MNNDKPIKWMQAILRVLGQHPLTHYNPAPGTIKPFILKQNIVEPAACFRYAGGLFRAFRQTLIRPGERTDEQTELTQ